MGGQLPLTIDTVDGDARPGRRGKLQAARHHVAEAEELLPGVKSVAEQGFPASR